MKSEVLILLISDDTWKDSIGSYKVCVCELPVGIGHHQVDREFIDSAEIPLQLLNCNASQLCGCFPYLFACHKKVHNYVIA